jgi:uncharacterized protein (DUF2236 family)
VTWRVNRESVVLLGGTRALLLQLAHPSVAAGVAAHSGYREDGLGRLRRTLELTMALTFAPRSEALQAAGSINSVHRRVSGLREDGTPYHALDPELLLWVLATLVDTSLQVYELCVAPLSAQEREAYYQEVRKVATHLGLPGELAPTSLVAMRSYFHQQIAEGPVHG